jgi:hypothetical protein
MLEHIVAIVTAEAGQGLIRVKRMQLGKCKDLARTLVATGWVFDTIVSSAIAEGARRVMVMLRDHRHHLLKLDRPRILTQAFQQGFNHPILTHSDKAARFSSPILTDPAPSGQIARPATKPSMALTGGTTSM